MPHYDAKMHKHLAFRKSEGHGRRKDYSGEGPIVDFPGVAKHIFARGGGQKCQNFISPTRNQENLFCSNVDGKMSYFKIQGGQDLVTPL